MARYIDTWVERYPQTMKFLCSDFVTLTKQNAKIWDAFVQTAKLDEAEALSVITFQKSPNGALPFIWFADLGSCLDGLFEPDDKGEPVPRFKFSIDVASHFEAVPANTEARTFVQGKVLHEMVHWSLYNHGKSEPPNIEMGVEFEKSAFGTILRRFWSNGAPTPLVTSPGSQPAVVDHGAAELSGIPEFGKAQSGQDLPRGIRNNNPGNIKRSGERWEGLANPDEMTDYQKRETVFCVFREPIWGLRAMGRILLNYQTKHRLTTVAAMIGRWAPPDDDNKTKAYVSFVAQRMNIGEGEVFDFRNPDRGPLMMSAIVRQENGIQPYSADQIVLAHGKAVA